LRHVSGNDVVRGGGGPIPRFNRVARAHVEVAGGPTGG
jgi:hypothetical protein